VDEKGESTRTIAMGSRLQIRAIVESEQPMDYPVFVVRIDNSKGQRMLTTRSPRNHLALPRLSGRHELVCHIDNLPFAPGEYSLRIALGKDLADIEAVENEISFTVRNADTFGDGWGARQGFCVAPSRWDLTGLVTDSARNEYETA
jgi:Wzt-like putative exopolysaccharide export protein